MDLPKDSKIKVIIRKRPLSSKEAKRGETDILEQRSPYSLIVKESKLKVDLTRYTEEHSFTFDHVFDDSCDNRDLYESTLKPLIAAALQGVKVTCFAYGQTGSGKTFTMMGEDTIPGLYALAANDLFRLKNQRIGVAISFYEIYCGRLHDLLNSRQQLFAREDSKQNVNIVGLQRRSVSDVQALMQLIAYGMSVRMTGTTGANDESSRSHAVLDIELRESGSAKGKLSFIDLAGSERGADVKDSDKQTRIDGAEINKSLLALKECIRALDQDKKHRPFRGSKLTQVLKDSFMGNCRTLMIGCVSPGAGSCEHTLNTLRYADRVKELRKGGGQPRNAQDALANELMLPRTVSNTVTYIDNAENRPPSRGKPKPQPPSRKPPKSLNQTVSYPALTQDAMVERHEQLISMILAEEEEVVSTHRAHLDEDVENVKREMSLLTAVDKPGSDIWNYVKSVAHMLERKEQLLATMKAKLEQFRSHLEEEEDLSSQLYKGVSSDVFDLADMEEDLLREVV